MRVLIINTSERIGGAAIAANRLMQALKIHGINAKMLVRDRQTDKMSVLTIGSGWLQPVRFLWERAVIFMSNGFSRKSLFQVDIANTGNDVTKLPDFKKADIIHLHWINQGCLSLADIDRILHSGKPVVITMHDMWYFTGICHHSADCVKYRTHCADCEIIGKGGICGDLARRVFARKAKAYADSNAIFVGCSQWITDLAASGALTKGHRVVSIPNPIDTDLFSPQDKTEARKKHGLPTDKRLLLFGSRRITDEMKGFSYMAEALRQMIERYPEVAQQVALVVVGAESDKVKDAIPLPVYAVDYVKGAQGMVELYNAVDVYVTPSLHENLPNTIMEAMSCGVPCVGFRIGGIPEMIDHEQSGYVANYRDAEDFARGIVWTIDDQRYQALSDAARQKVLREYSQESIANKYINLYKSARP